MSNSTENKEVLNSPRREEKKTTQKIEIEHWAYSFSVIKNANKEAQTKFDPDKRQTEQSTKKNHQKKTRKVCNADHKKNQSKETENPRKIKNTVGLSSQLSKEQK
ncbi:hypothetical protein M0813_24874 [Anaeramoeba flamelloides]|uniref:Uncharacterized protein n=1 Tax=Anaeramoeba flamelloides TaxID=1746091 RepID=A0ABQ8Y4A5_9EUKA|nr:hypothetical protein M0813_24874 [Anaeramoeba flamelloides]